MGRSSAPVSPAPRDAAVRVLLVEDYEPDVRLLQEMLREAGSADEFEFTVARTVAEAEARLRDEDYSLVLLDMGLPDGNGPENIERIRAINRYIAIVVMTGLDDERAALEALQRGAQEYVVKGSVDGARLVRTMRHAIERNRLVSELDQMRERDYYQATHDTLTGLPNRQLLNDRLRQVLSQASRHDERVAYVYLDLDGFKAVNDSNGHNVGDALLRHIGELIRKTIRDSDTAARVGGDEFVLVLHPLRHVEEARAIVDRVVARIDAVEEIDGVPVDIGASAGIAFYPTDGADQETLSRVADQAMYAVKRQRKQRRRTSDPARPATDGRLRFVPWVSCEDWALAGVEARTVLPGDPASATLSSDLTLSAALKAVGQWSRAGVHVPSLAINVSAADAAHAEFSQRLMLRLDAAGFEPARLQLELSEDECHPEAELLVNLSLLRSRGVRVVVNHFGRDSAAMGRVSRFPVDGLKLDARVVQSLKGGNASVRAMVESIVRFADALELDLFADGVQTPAERDAVVGLGCRYLQGPLFAEAMDADALPAALARDLAPLRPRSR